MGRIVALAAWVFFIASCGGGESKSVERDAGTDATERDSEVMRPDGWLGFEDGSVQNVVVTHPAAPPIPPATECTVVTAETTPTDRFHVIECSSLTFDHTPPTYGNHYPVWADFKTYDAPVPWGYLVHSMEHGAVVLVYACASDCDEIADTLDRVRSESTRDPLCNESTHTRVIVVPDSTLDVPIAAVAWGHIYRATCLDEESLRAFIDGSYAMGPENFCANGVDLSASNWCDG